MVELQHRVNFPIELLNFLQAHPHVVAGDFDSPTFQLTKRAVKVALNSDQGGLCVYCERYLASDAGQVEHIKPKGGPHAHPGLCFVYTNFAHSCISDHTCGQKKGSGLLPIEPGPGCNADWILSTDGSIEPKLNLTNRRAHEVRQTRGMLGLNSPALIRERKKFLDITVSLMSQAPNDVSLFLSTSPFRYILGTLL